MPKTKAKSSSKKPSTPAPAQPATPVTPILGDTLVPSPAAEPAFALAALRKELGAPNAKLLPALLQETSDDALVELGQKIGSGRVILDATRLYGRAFTFYKSATAAQRLLLRGFSQDLLVLGVDQALQLETLFDAQETQRAADNAVRSGLSAHASQNHDRAIRLRDQAADALRGAAGQSATRRAVVSESSGTADTDEALARGLEALAKLLRAWLKEASTATPDAQALQVRLSLCSLDETYAEELSSTAATLRSSSARSKNPPQHARLQQSQLDRADGINLLLLGRIIRAFEHGHGLDPSIPRLVPVSTRSILARKSTSPVTPKPEAPAPTPPTG